jgi:hypothetical protein
MNLNLVDSLIEMKVSSPKYCRGNLAPQFLLNSLGKFELDVRLYE